MASAASVERDRASVFTIPCPVLMSSDKNPRTFCFHLRWNDLRADNASCWSRKMKRVDQRYETANPSNRESIPGVECDGNPSIVTQAMNFSPILGMSPVQSRSYPSHASRYMGQSGILSLIEDPVMQECR